jgi:hypothetical protein
VAAEIEKGIIDLGVNTITVCFRLSREDLKIIKKELLLTIEAMIHKREERRGVLT